MSVAVHRLRGALRAVWAVAMLPPALAHELTHAALAAPVADSAAVTVQVTDWSADCAITWREGAPAAAIWLAYYGPLLLGTAIGIGAVAYIGVTRSVPQNAWDWWVYATLGVWWAQYVQGDELASLWSLRGRTRGDS